jgi:TonB family protein
MGSPMTMQSSLTGYRVIALTGVAVVHWLVGHILASSTAGRDLRSSSHDQRLLTVFIQPQIQDAPAPPGPSLSRISFTAAEPPPALLIDHPDIDATVAHNRGAGVTAPTLKISNASDMAPYVRQAALLHGEGATVVLRIEVLPTGIPGRIEIDVSSQSRQIDQAATAYARTRRWYAGRASGTPQVMWIRWAVRLQA